MRDSYELFAWNIHLSKYIKFSLKFVEVHGCYCNMFRGRRSGHFFWIQYILWMCSKRVLPSSLLLLSEAQKRFHSMLSSMSASAADTKLFLGNISETIRASDFKIYQKVALDSLYILMGNDVINYFRLEANLQTCKFWVMLGLGLFDNGSTNS